MADVVDLDFVKGYLGVSDVDTFDEDIEFLIPFYTSKTIQNITLDNLTEDQLKVVQTAIGSGIGCHLQKSRSKFRDTVKRYQIGNVEKEFEGRAFKETQNWCDTYDINMNEVEGSYGEGNSGSVKRLGIADEYSKPY